MSRLLGGSMIDADAENGPRRDGAFRPIRKRAAHTPNPLARRVGELVVVVKSLGDEPSAKAVHELRTTIRRVETLLPPAHETTGFERKLWKQLDRIRRRAGKVRDVDVHLKALRSLRHIAATDAIRDVRDAFRKARDKRQRKLAGAVGDERDRGLVKRLRQVIAGASRMPHVPGEAMNVVSRVVAEFDELVRGSSPLGEGNLHRLRIATKRLRYRVEPFLPEPSADIVVRELKCVQDAIGVWHDWGTLGDRVVEVLGASDAPLVAAVRARTQRELARAVRTTTTVAARLAASASAGDVSPAPARKAPRAVTARISVPSASVGTSV